MTFTQSVLIGYFATITAAGRPATEPIKVMIIGGQNNHDWAQSTPFMAGLLNKTSHLQATICNAPAGGASQSEWDAWQPKFTDFDCVILDYNGDMWPERVKADFVSYIQGGGGALVIHAANNAFTGWKEYEDMVGLLWRDPSYGSSLYLDDSGNAVREAPGQGRGMGHGSQYDWVMTVRDKSHPITQGMPEVWMHKKDELYHGQRGPINDIHILLTAYSDPTGDRRGTGKNEPIVWWIPSGKGKVVTHLMGHVGELDSMKCVGFRISLIRTCEWLATGKCITPIPANFPTSKNTSIE
jgi:hypothetical protein